MKFESLKDKCEYYRSLQDNRLIPGLYTLVMIDGRAFSKTIKTRFKLPFDRDFIEMMNVAATEVCKTVQGIKLAYVQSDEISFVMSDFDTPDTDSFFGYRTCKLLSVIPGIAGGIFNRENLLWELGGSRDNCAMSGGDVVEAVSQYKPVEFDAKVWQVPNANDMFSWFLYRQNDCTRNSKLQVARQYMSHSELMGVTADDAIQRLKDSGKVDWWHDFNSGEKFGRFIYKEEIDYGDYWRGKWIIHEAWELCNPSGREKFLNLVAPGNH